MSLPKLYINSKFVTFRAKSFKILENNLHLRSYNTSCMSSDISSEMKRLDHFVLAEFTVVCDMSGHLNLFVVVVEF